MTARFTAVATAIDGLLVLERRILADERGSFERIFDADDLAPFGYCGPVAQINRSVTREPGTVRGMHFQYPPHAEWKAVTCLGGSIYDVVVDLRAGSATFRRWVAVSLSASTPTTLLIPPGCAHGFQVVDGEAELLYVHSQPYVPAVDAGVRADDPALGITWPLPIARRSPRDEGHPFISADWPGIVL